MPATVRHHVTRSGIEENDDYSNSTNAAASYFGLYTLDLAIEAIQVTGTPFNTHADIQPSPYAVSDVLTTQI